MAKDINKYVGMLQEVFYDIDEVDINNKGLEITFETGDGSKDVCIPNKELEKAVKKAGFNPKIIEKIRQMPKELKKRYAIELLYRLMQDDDFKYAFLKRLKEEGIIYIPETKENITFLSVMKYLIFIAGIGIVLLLIVEMMKFYG